MKRNWIITTYGTLTQIICRTKKARNWLDKNVHYESWQLVGAAFGNPAVQYGNGIMVDSRMAHDIIEAIQESF